MKVSHSKKGLELLYKNGEITSDIPLDEYIEPASIDVPIGTKAYLVSYKISTFNNTISNIIKQDDDFIIQEIDLDKDHILMKGCTYLIPTTLTLNLSSHNHASVSPKSSIGRVDLFVRSIFDNTGLYDHVYPDSKGRVWLEVTPQSFNIKLKPYLALNQMMVFRDRMQVNEDLKGKEILFNKDKEQIKPQLYDSDKIVLTLDCTPNTLIGYVAKETNKVIDLSKIKHYDSNDYFEEVYSEDTGKIMLKKDHFYILSTKDHVAIPMEYSAEMITTSDMLGEFRAHYAGFFDPGFGYGDAGEIKGTTGVLEIRSHENILLSDGQPICLMRFYKNDTMPSVSYGSSSRNNHYQGQHRSNLAKYFR